MELEERHYRVELEERHYGWSLRRGMRGGA